VSKPPPAPSTGVPLPSRLRRVLAWADSWEEKVLLARPPAGPHGRVLHAGQVLLLTGRRYREDHAGDRAGALAFATLLSLLPLILIALSVVGAVGMSPETLQQVRRWLLSTFVPETAGSFQQTIDATIDSVQNSRRGFGTIGVLMLFLTGWKLLATLQRTFEQIWGARDFASRMRRMLGFWGTVMLAPFLVAASLVLSGFVVTLEARGLLPAGVLVATATYLLPAVPMWLGVLAIYRFCAGRRTTWRAAVVGAAVTALLWELLKIGFTLYVKRAFVVKTVLSGMGVVPVFLVWIYLSWVAFLLGAELAFVVHDYAGALRRGGIDPTSAAPGDPPPAR
jgi:membrane protein